MMSSVETDSAESATGQNRSWSENQSDIGGCEKPSSAQESKAVKFSRDAENGPADANHSTELAGTQLTSFEECPLEITREEINGKRPSSTPSADTASPPDNAEVPINPVESMAVAETANEPIGLRRVAELGEDGSGQVAPLKEEGAKSYSDSDTRRAYWTQQRNSDEYQKMMASATGEAAHFEAPEEQRQPSRSPSPSRNMSPSAIYGQSYQQYGGPFSSSISAPIFAGASQRPLNPAAPVVARHHAPFPFFANPFMVPFAPHLPQASISQQSVQSEKSTPEEWNSSVAGVRRNPDSGGFYLHPQYYHELLQQYLRNMVLAEAASEEATVEVATMDEQTAKVSADTSNGDGDTSIHERRPESATSDPNPLSTATSNSSLSREAVRMRLAGQTDSAASEWDPEAENAAGKSEDMRIESSIEGSPLKISRPETLPLDDASAKERTLDAEQERIIRNGLDADNPAMALIKKQISEIEKQILRKAQNQNIRKMDAKEIETFLLMEQQRTLEANLFESTTNTGAWAQTALPWLQSEAMHWDRAGAMADVLARQQFDPAPDQRSLFELAAVAAAAASDPTTAPGPSLNQPSLAAHFPQASSAFAPQPQSVYPSGMPWPPAPFYPPGTSAGFGFSSAPAYFPPAAGVYGGTIPPYLSNAQPYPSAVPPFGVLPPFSNGPQLQQQRHLDQDAAVRLSQALQMAQRGYSDVSAPTAAQATCGGNMDSGAADDGGPWPETNGDRYCSDQVSEDDPVWVLRESYVRKIKREEEPQAQKERDTVKQSQHETGEKIVHDSDTYNETDKLLDAQRNDSTLHHQNDASLNESAQQAQKKAKKKKEVMVHEPAVLIEGVLFRARYLGSTQLVCDGRPTKATRMMQAQEAVSRIKAPDGEPQPSTDVDLFISTEKIMVLNTDLQRISETDVRQDIMMDHPLRTISYIADIGELVVLMARRMSQSSPDSPEPAISRTPKVICHVFESEEAQFIAQSIGQAFQVAYMEFLRANGIDDPGYLRDVDYQEVLNSQEIFGEELEMFARKETQKDVVVPKQKNEILGVVIVESGWGSMLPTVVIANLMPAGPAARSNNLNIGDHIIALNGISFVGLPLSACQNHIRNVRHLTAVKLTIVHTPPVVEVRIKRPDTKYQLGFSVQNGVICSLLRGGIAERGGVRVGHRIIEINSQSVVAVPHEKIVTMLATAVGEIQMKTMPTSMFRLLTGQETPNYI